MADSAAITLPTPVLAISGITASVGAAAVILPASRVVSGNVQAGAVIALPAPVLSITGASGSVGSAAITMPTPILSSGSNVAAIKLPRPVVLASGLAGIVGSADIVLPAPTVLANLPNEAQVVLPKPIVSASGVAGAIGSTTIILPAPVLAASGETPYVGAVVIALPKPVIQASGTVGNVGALNVTLRGMALAAQGVTGSIGTATIELPVMRLQADGYQNAVGSATITMPIMIVRASGDIPHGSTSSTIVMHTENFALTTYENYPFNSFAKFNGLYLGASDQGIFALTGDTDNGVQIDAAARMGITDLSTSHLKRIDRCYVGYRTDGDMVLRVFTDEINQRDYLITASGADGLHGNHTRIGKGLQARYWQFEVRNKDGSYFELNALELKPTNLRRRIGGGDA